MQNTGDHVFFTVTEKDDVLGHVQIPVTSLQMVKGQVRKTALKPHKKCSEPHGDLIYQVKVIIQLMGSVLIYCPIVIILFHSLKI